MQQAGFDARLVRTDLIDEPIDAARATLDELALQDLITSIADVGLLEPLVVLQTGKRFRVLAGHRRFISCKALQWKEIPCVVRQKGEISGEAVTLHENAYREDLNPAEEAKYYGKLLETQCAGDVDTLCKLAKQSRNYVEGRLILLAGDSRVLDALQAKAITIGVAQELNKFQDGARRMVFLDAAIAGGATARTVRDWRRMDDQLANVYPTVPDDQAVHGVAVQQPIELTLKCLICESSDDVHLMTLFYVHKHCKRAVLDRILNNLNGVPDADPT